QHMPADGGPLTSEDARMARTRLASAGGEIGAFLDLRRGRSQRPRTVVAEARPPAQSAWQQEAPPPRGPAPSQPSLPARTLAEAPRLVAAGPSREDRGQLHNLVR